MRIALKWGAIVGVVAYLAGTIVLTLLARLLFANQPVDLSHPGVFTLSCLGIFGLLFAFSAAGYFTGRDTLLDGWGAVAGMVSLLVYYLLSLLYTPGAEFAASLRAEFVSVPGKSAAESAFAAGVSVAASAFIVFGIAALMGWLGGRPGAKAALKRLPKGEPSVN
jgi:hypothetical protein